MNIIYALLTISLSIASIFLGIFLWNLRNGQFDDDYTPAIRILFDDLPPESDGTPPNPNTQTPT